ncbi:TetR/AcrR family transcriptional regulator [Hoeflea prorocentri]|uniref:TetR/AcrR family transcriptional regulator n=1 Tax=Hoeflea prorocentri TaxID=1922333 RepID=A0A9X3ZFG1_9HYPH|nr:TetR/AcrR family transcriptional regulator [Hoeflea prorocentri]MCY6379168.1 TetR/AcrR family transcriptional regulator [Hoeflea prorocentri]MDA5396969.1 TetR/AcrR family transcriptional regulator [Hoeflea prorocentri]
MPKQKRSKKTVSQILEATIELLEEAGFSGVTMQKIADRAGINVAAVYSYFPNKHHVILELNNRIFEQRNDVRIEQLEELFGQDGHWADNFAESLRDLAVLLENQRGAAAVHAAMRASPALAEMSAKSLDRASDRIKSFLERADPDYPGDQWLRARVISEAVTSVFDLMQTAEDADNNALLNEAILMVRAYLKYPAEEAKTQPD